ncbi:hypothetical protein [Allokutzneria sp. NRRL B-24872]|uniref:hypothetical protein n=1 Tax=Allokutzneria sp. NRRL B-24872 TaxID=1137961 RepID=UPI000A3D3AF2|nr:hypothetical protein [Allokutzneria sp. NRRL B-24872]
MTEQPDINAAVVEASQWIDDHHDVVAVGQGEHDGEPTVDVWVANGADSDLGLPKVLHGCTVRIRASGGPIEAQ